MYYSNFQQTTLYFTGAADILRTYREQNNRQSQNVVDLWDTVIKKSIDKLGDESTYLRLYLPDV